MTWAGPALALSTVTANPGLTALAVASLAALVLMLWRPGEPPVLLFACGFQWLQSSLKVLYADVLGEEVWRLPDTPPKIDEASEWSMLWSLALGAGIAFMLRLRRRSLERAGQLPAAETFGDLLRLYLLWTALVFGLEPLLPAGLRQVLVALASLRWGLLFAVLAHAVRSREHLSIAGAALLVELGFGFLSFFSAFRTPLYVLALVLPEGRLRLRLRHVVGASVVAALTLVLAIVWSAIKGDYRQAISEGAGGQVVRVTAEEQVTILVDLVTAMDGESFAYGVDALIARVVYVDFLAEVVAFVPRMRAHEDGALWRGALSHVLLPRMFFPDKAALESDTRVAERYTGRALSQPGMSTSIALGAPAESYVDFGVPWMLAPALLFGMFAGFAYAWALGPAPSLVDRGLAVALVLPLATVENGPIKLFGGTLAAFLVALAVRPLLRRWLSRGAASVTALEARAS